MDTDGDDDGDNDEVIEEEKSVADDIEWDNLDNEDVLTGVGSSLQASGPFPFHGGEGTSGEPARAVHTVSLPQEPTEACAPPSRPKSQAFRQCAPGATKGEPLCPGAGGRLETASPR